MQIRKVLVTTWQTLGRIWPYALLFCLIQLISIATSLLPPEFRLFFTCLSALFSLLIVYPSILFLYRAALYVLDSKELDVASVTKDLLPSLARLLGLGLGTTLLVLFIFFLLGIGFLIILMGAVQLGPDLITDNSLVVLLLGCLIVPLLPLLLAIGIYSPIVMGEIIDKEKPAWDALRGGHKIVRAHWGKLLSWFFILMVPVYVLSWFVPFASEWLIANTQIPSSAFAFILLLASVVSLGAATFVQVAWVVIYRQLTKKKPATKARQARVSSSM